MESEPLGSYLAIHKEKPHFFAVSSGCWRGYVGTWEIKDEKLYLIEIDGYAEVSSKTYGKVDINYLFPNQSRVFAEWFTGEIKIPQGDYLNSGHGGYGLTHEMDLFIEFKNGQLVGKRTVDNLVEISIALSNRKENITTKMKSFLNKILDSLKRKK